MTEVSLNGVDEWLNYIESILDDTTYLSTWWQANFVEDGPRPTGAHE